MADPTCGISHHEMSHSTKRAHSTTNCLFPQDPGNARKRASPESGSRNTLEIQKQHQQLLKHKNRCLHWKDSRTTQQHNKLSFANKKETKQKHAAHTNVSRTKKTMQPSTSTVMNIPHRFRASCWQNLSNERHIAATQRIAERT